MGLKAVNCRTGGPLADAQATADSKEKVLKALGETAAKLRAKLGESLSTVEKFDTPVEQATTPSLEALQAYSLGAKASVGKGGDAAALPLFQRAVRLDPNFATAYALLGASYFNLGESNLAAENTRKAYQLRDRVSEREKFVIESAYYALLTGRAKPANFGRRLIPEMIFRPASWGGPTILSGNMTKSFRKHARPYDLAVWITRT